VTGSAKSGNRLALQVAVATLARLTINIGHRMVYPFLPAIARGLNISLQTAGVLMTARAAVGLVAAAFVVVLPRYPVVAVGFVLLGLSKVIFDPSLHAYLADRVPYRRRGRAIAFTELAWGGAILVGAPAMGWIIAQSGWSAPFAALVGMGLIGLIGLLGALPRDARPPGDLAPAPSFWLAFRLVLGNRAAVAVLAITCLVMVANELLFLARHHLPGDGGQRAFVPDFWNVDGI
jgi:predicted MFS family arabinose efflux permease